MMPELDRFSPVFRLDLSSFEQVLVDIFTNHEPSPTRSIERALKGLIYDRVYESASKIEGFISAVIRIHSLYNRQNKTLAALAREGLHIWYLEILTKWQKSVGFQAINIRIAGLQIAPITYGQDAQRTQNNYMKELKTQVNLKTTILHMIIPPELLQSIFGKVRGSQSFLIWDSTLLSTDRMHLLPIYADNVTDEQYICECSLEAFRKTGGIPPKCKVLRGICHLCQVNLVGKDKVVHLYGPEFLSNQKAFISQIQLIEQTDHRTAIEEVARRFQTSKWKTEALLYAVVRELFPSNTILREFSPKFLEGLRIDIFVKEINLAIEYQGEQHFAPVEAFGGEEAHKHLILRDKRKKVLCQQKGFNMLYFSYKEPITHASVQKKLRKYLDA